MPAIIEFIEVSKSFPKRGVVLNKLNYKINQGEMVGLYGPNGSGKSTLLFICAGLETMDEGEVIVEGVKLSLLSEESRLSLRRKTIGFAFQGTQLIPHFTVLDNVMLPLFVDGLPLRVAQKQAKDTLEELGVLTLQSKKPTQLSGGEQQLIEIARALVRKPPILLIDEPTAYLDQSNRDLVLKIMKELRSNNRTILVTAHDTAVMEVVDRVWEFKKENNS